MAWTTLRTLYNVPAQDLTVILGSGGVPDAAITTTNGIALRADSADVAYKTRNSGKTWQLAGAPGSSFTRKELFDDFTTYQTLTEADSPYILNSGADAQAIDPALSGDVMVLTTGDADGTVANDGSQLLWKTPLQAQDGNLVAECKLHINTAITGLSVFFGLTDSTALEEPFTGATDTITSVATDAVGFLFDDGNTTKEWFACAVDGDTDDTGNGATGDAPVADTYQTLRIEVPTDGTAIRFYVDDVLTHTLSVAGVSPDVNLYATVVACSTTTASKTVDVDYLYAGVDR